MERARKRVKEGRIKNKDWFDKTHPLRPRKIEEGEWVLVYDSSLDNQHRSTRKFARRWFRPYVVTNANNNATYLLAELDGTRIAVPVAGQADKGFHETT